MHQSVRAVITAALLAGALSGCSLLTPVVGGAGSAEGQTVREACDQMLPALSSMNADLTAAYDEVAKNPAQASPLLRTVSANFRAAIDKIDNEVVIEVTTTAADSLDAMTDEIEKSAAGEQNTEALQAAAADVQTDFTAIDTVCKP